MARLDTGMAAFERGDRYVLRVNKARLDVERHTDYLNEASRLGYRVLMMFEQGGNTITLFEHEHGKGVGCQACRVEEQ
jgi:hypothetical protein